MSYLARMQTLSTYRKARTENGYRSTFVELYQSMELIQPNGDFVRKFPALSSYLTFSSILIGQLEFVWLLSQLTLVRWRNLKAKLYFYGYTYRPH